MSNTFSFSSSEDEALIGLVENNKVIFDSGHKKYKDIYFKDNIWKNIFEEVGRSYTGSDDCKKRWKNIRDTYIKQKKKLPTGSETPLKKNRCTMNLSVLDTVEYERIILNTITNMVITGADTSNASTTHEIGHEDKEDVQNDEEQTQNIMSDLPSSSCAGKRSRSKEDKISAILAKRSKDTKDTILRIQKQNKLLAKNLCEEDDIDLFYKSIATTVKKMPPQAIKGAKLKTLTLITEIDDKYSTRQTLPYQTPLDHNNMYQCQLSSPANSFSTSTSSQGFLLFNYGDESNA